MSNIQNKSKYKGHYGFSLIEIIIYISLLSVLMIGVFSSVLFSVYMGIKKPIFTDIDYQLLIHNYYVQ